MSIDNFVGSCRTRLSVLEQQIADIIKKDGGKKIHRHMRTQLVEAEKLRTAIYKAERAGVRE